ncbi:putative NBD/HSP70 family sugar kinase [Mucilaginibacter yixingensis]|uniref:Putative NBD/HSP70 family sugar kinase n=1 Tax=Mucilaginibacter yixingensis TaxID=1295612 RepID=A0A2T5J615_9SPHI|nr:ROK family protein [Mucilaginibacter yixingensis]PTQ93974.1 putative NBD/HSP70 family sugar kinase [Mucilaginibacter yixingensis]
MTATETFLTLHIGGAHFSTCLFNRETGGIVPQSYQRIPVSYKVGQNMLLQIWANAIADLPAKHLANLTGCAVSVPLPFIDPKAQYIPACAERYAKLYPICLVEFFAEILNLQPEDVQLHYNGTAYLKGELFARPGLDVPGVAGVHFGTDLSASVITGGGIQHLGWESKRYLNKRANDYLSAQALMRGYHQETGISVMNVGQLTALSKESVAARDVLKDFLRRALSFLVREAANSHIHTVVLGGDLVRYNLDFFQNLKEELSTRITCWSNRDDTFHRGLFQLFQESEQHVSLIEF